MKRNRNSLHVIERENRMIRLAEQVWESGYWPIPESQAKQLRGGSIFFHKKPKHPSFFGGIIVDYRVQDKGPLQGRVVFTFEYQADHRNVLAGGKGWSREMRIVVKE